jgi:hypothetical protein
MTRARVVFLLLGACATVGPGYVPPAPEVTVSTRLPSAIGFQAADWWTGPTHWMQRPCDNFLDPNLPPV